MQVLHEIETLNGGLTDTIKAVAEELEIKPAILKKAIKLAHKAEFGKEKQDHETLETILETVGKTLWSIRFLILGYINRYFWDVDIHCITNNTNRDW